MLLINSIQLKY